MNYTGLLNNTGKNDSINLHFAPDNNFDQAIAFRISITVVNAFFSFTVLLGNCDSINNLENMFFTLNWEHLTDKSCRTSLLACSSRHPLFKAVIQKRIPTIILVFNILMYVFCCASLFTITAITINRLLVLHSKIYVVFLVMVIGLRAGNFVVNFKIYLISRRHQRQIQHRHQHQRQASNENDARITRLKKTAFNTCIVYIQVYLSVVTCLSVSQLYTVEFP